MLNSGSMKDLLIPVSLFCFLVSVILLSANPSFVDFLQEENYEREVVESLFLYKNFRGHVWHIAPMENRLVALDDGRLVTVIADHWDSCEHNPDQNHTIAVEYVDEVLYEERVRLDRNPATRNFVDTYALLVWVDSSQVNYIIK